MTNSLIIDYLYNGSRFQLSIFNYVKLKVVFNFQLSIHEELSIINCQLSINQSSSIKAMPYERFSQSIRRNSLVARFIYTSLSTWNEPSIWVPC